MRSITVQVPARPDYVHIVRSVVAAAAAKAAMLIDEIEDIRLAVDEACAHLLAVVPQATTLTVDITEAEGTFEFFASVDAEVSGAADKNGSIIWHILSALTDDARLEPTASRTGIRMTKQALGAGTGDT